MSHTITWDYWCIS